MKNTNLYLIIEQFRLAINIQLSHFVKEMDRPGSKSYLLIALRTSLT
jgi:hypothetical protein